MLNGEVKRSSNYTLQPDDNAIEDSRLITGWYKIDSATGNDIVNESVSMGQCGTLYPVWMLGKYNIQDYHGEEKSVFVLILKIIYKRYCYT